MARGSGAAGRSEGLCNAKPLCTRSCTPWMRKDHCMLALGVGEAYHRYKCVSALDSFATPELERYTMRSTPISTLSCESRFRYLSCPAMCVLGFVSKHIAYHEASFRPEVRTFPCIRNSVTNCVNCSRSSRSWKHRIHAFRKSWIMC